MLRPDFDRLLLENSDHLHRHALRLARKAPDADDLVQDTLVRAVENCDKFQAGTNIRAWLTTIMHNLFVSRVILRGRKAEHIPLDEMFDQPAAPSRAEEELVGEDARKEYTWALADLRSPYRETFVRVVLLEQEYLQVAREMEVPVGTVMSRLFRARQSLRRILRSDAEALGIRAAARRN